MTSNLRPRVRRLKRSRRSIAGAAVVVLIGGLATNAAAVDDEGAACEGVDSLGHINNAPLAVDDEAWVEPEGTVIVDVLANDLDFDGDDLTITDLLPAGHGLATITNGSIQYQPGLGFEGIDTFQYVISDGKCGSHQASVRVQVSQDPPPVDEAKPDPPVTAPIQLTG